MFGCLVLDLDLAESQMLSPKGQVLATRYYREGEQWNCVHATVKLASLRSGLARITSVVCTDPRLVLVLTQDRFHKNLPYSRVWRDIIHQRILRYPLFWFGCLAERSPQLQRLRVTLLSHGGKRGR